MSYQVIARKYRPQRFADVVGQEHVTRTLTNAIERHRIAHAYLFCGPRGTGKTTVARIFAKALNCTDGPKADFDVADPRCVEIADGRSLDVLEIDGASNNGVEQVRELRETCRFAPAASRFKIYIIDEVHILSPAAFNALLKTLEEPPAHVKFMFATTDPEKILPTILSRCQRFDLRRIPAALIVQHLGAIAAQEGVRADDAALHAIARGADGGMRDAESTLDQLISFCGNEIAETDVLSMFGLAARGQLLALTDAVIAGDADGILRELDELARNGKDLGRLLADLLNHFRNLLIFQVGRGDTTLLEASEAEIAALKEQAGRLGVEAVTRVMEVLAETEGRLRDAVSKKIALEVALLRAIQVRNAVSLDAVIGQLKALRGEGVAPPPPATAFEARPASAPVAPASALRETPLAPAPTASVAETPVAAAAIPAKSGLAEIWSAVLEGIGRSSQFLRSYLLKGFPVSCERETLTIGFPTAAAQFLPLINNLKNQNALAAVLKQAGFTDPRVKFVLSDAAPPEPVAAAPSSLPAAAAEPAAEPSAKPVAEVPVSAPPPAPETPPARPARPALTKLDPATFKDDPLIKQALEIFKGRIAQVVAPAGPTQ
jgi:DNA polymerase-3 subunit gamma/tau